MSRRYLRLQPLVSCGLGEVGRGLTSKKQFKQTVRQDEEARVREGVKAVLEDILQEEMTAGRSEREVV